MPKPKVCNECQEQTILNFCESCGHWLCDECFGDTDYLTCDECRNVPDEYAEAWD